MVRVKILVVIIVACGLFNQAINAQDATQLGEVNNSWNNFLSALKWGDYEKAYLGFSELSRKYYSYEDFLLEYAPYSNINEMVLSKSKNYTVLVKENWATIEFNATTRKKDRSLSIVVNLCYDNGKWYLVAGRAVDQEKIEAQLKIFLQNASAVINESSNQEKTLVEIVNNLANKNNRLVELYEFKTHEKKIQAIAKYKEQRHFTVDGKGNIFLGLVENKKQNNNLVYNPPKKNNSIDDQNQKQNNKKILITESLDPDEIAKKYIQENEKYKNINIENLPEQISSLRENKQLNFLPNNQVKINNR